MKKRKKREHVISVLFCQPAKDGGLAKAQLCDMKIKKSIVNRTRERKRKRKENPLIIVLGEKRKRNEREKEKKRIEKEQKRT